MARSDANTWHWWDGWSRPDDELNGDEPGLAVWWIGSSGRHNDCSPSQDLDTSDQTVPYAYR